MTPTGPPGEPGVISSYLKLTCLPLPALCEALGGCLTPAWACPELGWCSYHPYFTCPVSFCLPWWSYRVSMQKVTVNVIIVSTSGAGDNEGSGNMKFFPDDLYFFGRPGRSSLGQPDHVHHFVRLCCLGYPDLCFSINTLNLNIPNSEFVFVALLDRVGASGTF